MEMSEYGENRGKCLLLQVFKVSPSFLLLNEYSVLSLKMKIASEPIMEMIMNCFIFNRLHILTYIRPFSSKIQLRNFVSFRQRVLVVANYEFLYNSYGNSQDNIKLVLPIIYTNQNTFSLRNQAELIQ